MPKVAWVTRSFLDYRIPVFKALDELLSGNLHLIFSGDYVPESVQSKVKSILGERAIAMHGEWKVGPEDRHTMANRKVSIRFQPGLMRQIRSIDPEVLVCDGFFKWTFPSLLYRLIHGVPIVINYERTHHTERHVQFFRTLYRKIVVKYTDAMDCSGSLCAEYTKSLGIPAERITTGHMVADIDPFIKQTAQVSDIEIMKLRQQLSVEGILCTYIGSLNYRKGCRELIEAWHQLEKISQKKATLMLIGTGKLEAELKSYCDDNTLQQVRFIGSIPYEDLVLYYVASDVFIIPTLEDNWSLVVPEAMACGLPILCSKYNGCWPELVHDGKNGWVFDPLDPKDFIRALKLCLDNRKDLKWMGETSRQIIRLFSPERAAHSILEACEIALDRRKKI